MDTLRAILKQIAPDVISATISLAVAYWLLQAVSTDVELMYIIKIATTIFIVFYLGMILLDTALRIKDEHEIRQVTIKVIESGRNFPSIIDAPPSPRLIGTSLYSSSSYSFPSRSKNFLSILRIVLIVVLVVFVLASIFVFSLLHLSSSPPSHIHPTPSVVATNPWASWQTIPHTCSVVGRFYQVRTAAGQDLTACYGPKTQLKNFTYTVEMTILKGHCGGLLFRKGSSVNRYYVFQVCQDKTYALLKYVDDAGKIFQPFFGITKDNRMVHPGLGVMNTIAVTAQGSTFKLFINHTQVAAFQDTSYAEGIIGLVASTDLYYETTEVAYQHVSMHVLS